MLRITCPCCGADAEETEFTRGSEAHIRRPDSQTAKDQGWAAYLHGRSNPAGPTLECWHHSYGCGKWFHLARDTVTQQIYATYSIRESGPPPEVIDRTRAGSRR